MKNNKIRTDVTIVAQDYLKQWKKIKGIQPVLDDSKAFSTAMSTLNNTVNFSLSSKQDNTAMDTKIKPAIHCVSRKT